MSLCAKQGNASKQTCSVVFLIFARFNLTFLFFSGKIAVPIQGALLAWGRKSGWKIWKFQQTNLMTLAMWPGKRENLLASQIWEPLAMSTASYSSGITTRPSGKPFMPGTHNMIHQRGIMQLYSSWKVEVLNQAHLLEASSYFLPECNSLGEGNLLN